MKLSVISFNIRCCNDPDGHSIPERAPRLESIVLPYDADVIGLQESTPRWLEYLEESFGDKYEIFNKYRSSTSSLESTPVLWKKDKFDCLDKGCFWFSDTPDTESRGWDEIYDVPRICTYVILRDKESSRSFVFMNLHLGFGDDCQIKSTRLVYEYSKKLSDLPTFVTGDFNMRPTSIGYSTMTENFTDVNTVTAKDMRPTYHGYHPETAPDLPIDFCFIDKKVTPISLKVIRETVDGKYPSDHFGLFCELNV